MFERAFVEGRAAPPGMASMEHFMREAGGSFVGGMHGMKGGANFADVWKGRAGDVGKGANSFVEEFDRMGLGLGRMFNNATYVPMVGRGAHVAPWRWGGYGMFGDGARLSVVQRDTGEVERVGEREEENEGVKESVSWGDEFTSLEGEVGRHVESTHEVNFTADEDTFERMYEVAFREYIGVGDQEREYRFAEREQIMGRSALDALEEGVQMRELGRLSMAIALFEEALNRSVDDPHPPLERGMRAKAWFLLGLSLAERDDDEMAIVALRKGLKEFEGDTVGERRRDHPYLMQSLLSLAVSYTNELDQPNAYIHIKEWFEIWKEGNGVANIQADTFDDVFQDATKAGAQRLLGEMSTAVRQNPQDTDLYVVMGVLHNLHREYTDAATVLRQAVTLRPSDPSLWNKLGATLANGGEGDDALRAYRRAVDINPALVRAWVNVGTAYSNRQEFAKAARYYLKSISLAQEHGSSDEKKGLPDHQDRMDHVWGYLRTTLLSMSRADILHLIDARDVAALRPHFNF